LLLGELIKSKGRLVFNSSIGHNWTYVDKNTLDLDRRSKNPHPDSNTLFAATGTIKQYGYTKLLQILHCKKLSELYFDKYNVKFNTCHPGLIILTFKILRFHLYKSD
jgi:hypothetical protein